MFLNKRKLASILIVSCISIFTIKGQESVLEGKTSLLGHKKMFLNGKTTYLPIYKKNVDNNHTETAKEAVKTAYDSNWSNTVFNTYWKEKLTYPFEISFKEGTFSSPVDHKMVVTSRYGWRRGRAHQGIDIDLKTGDNVKTLLGGKVRYARYHRGHGKTIIVRHDNGLETVYAHLSEYLVKENDIVKKGQVIGKGGVSGNARGSHLHLEVRYMGKSIHPEYFFDFDDETVIRSEKMAVPKVWGTPRLHKSTRRSKVIVYEAIEDIVQEEESTAKDNIYIVKRGDTLYGIASKYDVNVSEICKINSIRYNTVLNIGQELLLY